MGEPHIRKVRPEELEEVWRVHVAASNDLVVRNGRPAPRAGDAPVAMASQVFGRLELYLPSGPILC